jgi:hypothetical protein
MKSTVTRIGLRFALVATAVGVTVALTGCLESSTNLPTSRSTSHSSATTTSTARPSAIGTPSPIGTAPQAATKFAENCSTLLTAAQVYAYNPNYVADTAYAPKAGSIAASIAANLGQTCGWVNETSGVELAVGVAKPAAAVLASTKSTASSGTPISANGENGYFAVANGVGSAQFFIGSLWVDISSADFTSPSDAQPVYSVVVRNQLSAGG